MCPLKDDATNVTLHTVKLTLVRFLYLNPPPSLMDLRL